MCKAMEAFRFASIGTWRFITSNSTETIMSDTARR
jgi:hypothetical protein